jgi:hypothetical protein
MKPHLYIVLSLICSLLVTSCVRHAVTPDGRLIPNGAFELDLKPPAPVSVDSALLDTTVLYTATMSKDALGVDGISILYGESRGGGTGTRSRFDALGVMRLFPDGHIIWKFLRQSQPGVAAALPDGFGDDFAAGYVGRYKVDGRRLSAEFYVSTMGGTCFALFDGLVAADGSITFTSYKTRKHGEFSLNNHIKVIQPLMFTKRAVGPMNRAADW